MATNDSLKKLFDEFPKLRDHGEFTSEVEFQEWRTTNAPEIPETIWNEYLAPTTTVIQVTDATSQSTSDPSKPSTHKIQADPNTKFRPTHDIEEDSKYQNTVKNIVDDFNKQNPSASFKNTVFIKNPTGKVVLNPDLIKTIPNLHQAATDSMRTGFGDDSVDRYKDSEKFRVYKNRLQDPTYNELLKNKNDSSYDEFVKNHKEKAYAYAKKDSEMEKALKRRNERIKEQQKTLRSENKEKSKKYTDPNDDPILRHTKEEIEKQTENEYQQALASKQRSGQMGSVDREIIRNKIKQLKYDEFFKNYPDKGKDYAKKDPEIKAAYSDYQKRRKEQLEQAKRESKKKEEILKKLRKNKDPQNDPRIQAIEAKSRELSSNLPGVTDQGRAEHAKMVRKKQYEEFTRNNPEIAKIYASKSPEIKSARDSVLSARKKAQEKSLFEQVSNKFPGQNPPPIIPPSPLEPKYITTESWLKHIGKSTIPQEKNKAQSEDDDNDAWRGQNLSKIKSYFQSNHAPSGLTRPSEYQSANNPPRTRPQLRLPKRSRSAAPANNPATKMLKKGGMALLRAAAPYLALGALVVFIILFIILIIYFVVTGGGSDSKTTIRMTKTGPPNVENGQNIEFSLSVTTTGLASDVIVTDPIPANTEYVSSTPQGRLLDSTGSLTTDPTQVKKVEWSLRDIQGMQSSSPSADIPSTSPVAIDPNASADTGTIHNLGLGASDASRVDEMIRKIRPDSPVIGHGNEIVQFAHEFNLDPLMIIVWHLESQFCTDGLNIPSTYGNNNCGNQDWDASKFGADVARWRAREADPDKWSLNHNWTYVPTMKDGLGLHFDYIDNPLYTGKTFTSFYEIYNPCSDSDPFNLGCGAQSARAMFELMKNSIGPPCEGADCYLGDGDGGGGNTFSSQVLKITLKPTLSDIYIKNEATARVIGGRGGPGDGVIDIGSLTLQQAFTESASNTNVPVAFLKAISKTENGGALTSYSEDDVAELSTNNWWAGKIDNAPTRDGNDPLILKGFGYNTCQYHGGCFDGADVRGAMQFEIQTWNGVKDSLQFDDSHDPDRRYPKDIIFGAGILIRDIAARYDQEYGTHPNPDDWTEDKVRRVSTAYCTGSLEGDPEGSACAQGGQGYDDLTWGYYQEYKGAGE